MSLCHAVLHDLQVRLRESVPLRERKPAGVSAACHGGVLGNLIKKTTTKIDHVGSLVAA